MEVKNAVIESVTLEKGDRGFLQCWLHLSYGGSGQGFGGYALYLPKSFAHHSMQSVAGHFMFRCMEVAGVDNWADMAGRTIRVRADNGKVYAIGHIVKDDWFDPAEDFSAKAAQAKRGAVPEGDDGKRVLREVFALCEDTEAKTYEEPGDFARGRRFEAKGIARAIGAWYQEEFCGRTHMGEPAAPAPDQFRDAAKMVPVHCTPTEHEGRIVYEHTSEPIPNADGFVLYAASADQFRTAAKMMAVQPACMTCSGHGMIGGLLPNGGGYESDPCPDCTAPAPTEVLMPKPVAYGFGNTAITGHTNRLMMVRIDIPGGDQYAGAFWLPLVLADEAHTYGIACRAAGEAAGYARGLTEAGREAKRLADAIVREVAELPDRDSPADWPAAMLVTSDELRGIVLAALRGEVKP